MPRTAINYENTIIYKIVCKDLNIEDAYVGHATDYIKRKSTHKCSCNNDKCKNHNLKIYLKIRENGGWDNWEMIEIEKYPCHDKNEACARERYWYEELNSRLNTRIPIYKEGDREKYLKQYTIDTKEKRSQYNYENKARLNELKKQTDYYMTKYICDCGSYYSRKNKKSHEMSQKHLKYLESL
jgi:hypothetical protein